MKLVRLTIQNYRQIKAAIIPIGPCVTKIGGKNAAGKSTSLDAIEEALAGARAICEKPVRTGEAYARNVLEFDNGMTVVREYDVQGASRLIVKDPKSAQAGANGVISAGQRFLDALTGKGIAFDPLLFLTMDALKQFDTLARMKGLDFSKLDDQIEVLNKERALAGRDVTGRKTQIESMPEYPGVPVEEVSAADLSAELTKALEFNVSLQRIEQVVANAQAEAKRMQRAGQEAAAQVVRVEEALSEMRKQVSDIEAGPYSLPVESEANAKKLDHARKQLAAWQKAIADCEAKARDLDKRQTELENAKYRLQILEKAGMDATAKEQEAARLAAAALEALTTAQERIAAAGQPVDVAGIKARLAGIEDTNRQVRANLARRQLEAQFRELKDTYEAVTRQIDALQCQKGKMIREAKLPVEGLELGLQCVLYNGEPFSQASSAEQYRVSTAMSFELCPLGDEAIRIALIRNASLLDDDSMKIISDTAERYGAQLVLEVVTAKTRDEADVDVVIEDGEAREPIRQATEEAVA